MEGSITGREVPVSWRGRTVQAWLPDLLADRDTGASSAAAIRSVERARQAVINADLGVPSGWEAVARLLLRTEGVSSSYIEGVHADVPEVAFAVAAGDAHGAAGWVAANLKVIDRALAHAHSDEPLDVDVLLGWHRGLMAGHTALPERLVGGFRDEVGWIGGTSPLDAALVVAPPETVPGLVADLLAHLNAGTADPIADAAVTHAQFEVIHPFGDGNGRLGRALILWVLARRTGVRVLPPLSTRLAADRGGYLAGLTSWRIIGADGWIRWFADAVTDSAGAVRTISGQVDALARDWSRVVADAGIRSDAAARRLLLQLPAEPVFTSRTAAERLHVSERAARGAITTLSELGIITSLGSRAGAPRDGYRWWSAPAVLALISG